MEPSKYERPLTIKLEFCKKLRDMPWNDPGVLLDYLHSYHLIQIKPIQFQSMSMITVNTNYNPENPPKCTKNLPFQIQFVLACLHTHCPQIASYQVFIFYICVFFV